MSTNVTARVICFCRFSIDDCVNSLERAARFSDGADGDHLDAVTVQDDLDLLTRLDPEGIADLAGDHDLVFG
jgi:hypothetical protein